MRVSAVIPAFNERDNLLELTKRLVASLEENVGDFDIVYVYQGLDGGEALLEDLRQSFPEIHVEFFPHPLGVGTAFRVGFGIVDGTSSHVLTMDADLNHEPEALPRFLDKAGEADVVVGSRYVQGGDWEELLHWKKLFSPIANSLLARAFRLDIRDLSSGYRLYRTEVVKAVNPELTSGGYEFYPESLIRAARKGFSLTEVPIVYRRRRHGESKIKPLETAVGYLRLLLALRSPGRKPPVA